MLDIIRSGDSAELRKERGAFFTPMPIARFIADWAVTPDTKTVLEPSCGEAGFLLAAAETAGRNSTELTLAGVELFPVSAAHAWTALAGRGVSAEIQVGDFFDIAPTGSQNAVIGNPPFIRYQDHSGESRSKSLLAARNAGVELSELASSWAAFVVHSAAFLRPGGRLGLVLPAELLSVNYAAPVRSFLLERFSSVTLVAFEERVFPTVQEEVVLLLADGYREGPTASFEVHQTRNSETLGALDSPLSWTPVSSGGKWTSSIVAAEARGIYDEVLQGGQFVALQAWGETSLGAVTGNNRWFTMTWHEARELGIHPRDLVRISPPGSRHLRGLELSKRQLRALGEAGQATYLFRPAGDPSGAAAAHIAAGEASGINQAYKCRVRKPWWRVPLVATPDLFLTYMNADTPRLTTNSAGVKHLNSIHGVFLGADARPIGRDLLPLASLNSLTMLGAEIVGRSYGGGMLKIEPGEADLLPVPTLELVSHLSQELRNVKVRVGHLLKIGKKAEATALVDGILLVGGLNLPLAQVDLLREARETLLKRRKARGKASY